MKGLFYWLIVCLNLIFQKPFRIIAVTKKLSEKKKSDLMLR